MKNKYLYILLLFFGITLIACKKYPENTLWFKNVKKINFFNGKLTSYEVNGIDSLNLLNSYFGNFAGLFNNINQCEFQTDNYASNYKVAQLIYGGGLSMSIGYSYKNKYKQIEITLIQDTSFFKKNIFVSNGLTWDILKLEPNGSKKIKTIFKGNTYILQIN